MSSEYEILKTILEETLKERTFSSDRIRHSSRALASQIEKTLIKMEADGAISRSVDGFHVTSEQRLMIAQRAILSGADPERISRALSWQEFEDLAVAAFKSNGFSTKKHFVFKADQKRNELDILALREPLLLCVDCKRWARGWGPSRVRNAVRDQRNRTRALLLNAKSLGERAGFNSWTSGGALPLLLALADVNVRVVDGTPIVSVLRLGSFLAGISAFAEGLNFERF